MNDKETRYYRIIDAVGQFWNNATGWGDFEGADVFTYTERKNLNLPIGGDWSIDLGSKTQ